MTQLQYSERLQQEAEMRTAKHQIYVIDLQQTEGKRNCCKYD